MNKYVFLYKKIILILLIVVQNVYSLYEDQVGVFDWKLSFIGSAKLAQIEGNHIFVITENHVLACLKVHNGEILWRHLLETPHEDTSYSIYGGNNIIITLACTNSLCFVRGWVAPTGILLWEWTHKFERPEDTHLLSIKDRVLTEITLCNDGQIEIATYNTKSGEIRGNKQKVSAPWLTNSSKCTITSTCFACITEETLYFSNFALDSRNIVSIPLTVVIPNISSNINIKPLLTIPSAIVLVHKDASYIVLCEPNESSIHMQVSSNFVASTDGSKSTIYQLQSAKNNSNTVLRLETLDWTQKASINSVNIDYPLALGAPILLNVDTMGNHILIKGSDNSLSLLDTHRGILRWTREEALSNVIAAEFFELPVSDLDASIESEFTISSSNILKTFLHRITTQSKQINDFVFGKHTVEGDRLVRDEFGLHKMLVVVTNVGKIFGIDTSTGIIIWSYRIPNIKPFENLSKSAMLVLTQRTARYTPFAAQVTLVAQDSITGNGLLFQFDPITGYPINEIIRLKYSIKQAFIVPHENSQHIKPIIIVSKNDQVFIYPESDKQLVAKYVKQLYFYIIDSNENTVRGYRLHDTATVLQPAWELNFAPAKILSMGTRPNSERVHSQGRVLPDRSVYYKYVNPNLFALATIGNDPNYRTVLSVYLIDGVSGLILYSMVHRRVRGPFHLVHSENWLVYMFYNERLRRTELVSSELFEGHVQSNSTVFSSFAISQLPYVQSQCYILPVTNTRALQVTLTERGITNKYLLIGFSTGSVVEIPWLLLQPRFSDVCGPEENCIPYMPEIPILSESIINYNQSIARIADIVVGPAKLESTIHVLIHGLDLFYTRVAPSKTFDLLKEDFDHRLIVLVLAGLIITSYLAKYFVQKKVLKQAWK